MSCRAGHQETGVDTESVAATNFNSQSKVTRDRDSNVVHSLRDRDHLPKKSLNGKLTRPYEVSCSLSKHYVKLRPRLRPEIGRRGEILTSLFMRSIRSLNLNDFSYIKHVDGHIRLRERK